MTPTRRALATTLALTAALAATSATAQAADTPQHPWYLDTMRVEEIWEHTKGEGITVAVIDSGVDSTLPELEGRVLEGIDITASPQGAHVDSDGHGTDMAALIAGNGTGQGIQGIAPESEILPIRVTTGGMTADISGRWSEAVEFAAESGAQIISISQGSVHDELMRRDMEEALTIAAQHGVIIFAASGNDGEGANTLSAPASLDGIIGVGAIGRDGDRISYSTYGPQVALASPGQDVPSYCGDLAGPACIREGGGTSAATALAAGSAALIWSQNPEWTKNQVLRVMLNTAERSDDQRRDDFTGYGIVRPDRVIVDGEGDPGDPDSPPIFRDWEAGLVPPATPEPTPETTPDDSAEPAPGPEAEAAATSDDSSPLPWILGGTAAVLFVAVTGWLLFRRRAA
ncbi:S8 family serine peptidase [Streptomyces xiamenensis]|uniref:S8 family serine peptidase n=1 Tax=Streptomyces xiamenensis TaxID=408015 RepID=UPI0035D58017